MNEIISLGAGVQSSTMALMAAQGEIKPMPIAAIFADTQVEPPSVYKWLDWLEGQLPFPVIRSTKGNLGENMLKIFVSKKGNLYTKSTIPAFITDGIKKGIMMRQCTADYKIVVIHREIRKLIGKKRTAQCIQWMGISIDEAHRMKDSRKRWITNRYPLIEKTMSRSDCLHWMEKKGYPNPPRSACIFCPFHSNAEWLRLKTQEPCEFARAIAYEKQYQKTCKNILRGVPFFHNSCKPLSEIDFIPNQKELWGNECEGLCGV